MVLEYQLYFSILQEINQASELRLYYQQLEYPDYSRFYYIYFLIFQQPNFHLQNSYQNQMLQLFLLQFFLKSQQLIFLWFFFLIIFHFFYHFFRFYYDLFYLFNFNFSYPFFFKVFNLFNQMIFQQYTINQLAYYLIFALNSILIYSLLSYNLVYHYVLLILFNLLVLIFVVHIFLQLIYL